MKTCLNPVFVTLIKEWAYVAHFFVIGVVVQSSDCAIIY